MGNNRLGEIRMMHCGDYAKVVEYNSVNDIRVEFQDDYGYTCKAEYWNFAKGHVRNPYHKNQYGGYVGDGKYKVSKDRRGTYIYDAWVRMLERSCSNKFKEKYSTYKDVTCCDEWLCFQNFAEWYENNYYEIEGQTMELDKDWMKFGNKVYCPEFCVISPSIINSCILNHGKIKNYDLPTGITCINNMYKVRISIEGKRIIVGSYESLNEAKYSYKTAKIEYVKYLAEKYREYIPNKLYTKMIEFENRFDKEFPEYATVY